MRRWLIPAALVGAAVAVAAAAAVLWPAAASSDSSRGGNNVLRAAVDYRPSKEKSAGAQVQHLSSGPLVAVLQAQGAPAGSGGKGGGKPKTVGCQNRFEGGGVGVANTRVNQDCGLRRQAEEVIAINPTNESNLVAGQNDSRNGFNQCGYDFSFDGGKTWGDQVPPFYQFLMADGATADACSDPTATFDADGNVYVGGVLFDVIFPASAFVVAKSNAGIGGAFYHSPVEQPFQTSRTVPLGVVASDNDPNVFHDKEFIVADANAGSLKKNNVYATWTRFDLDTGAGVTQNSPIYFSQSTDGGATWSPGIEISGSNAAACTDFSGSANPNACDQDQGSHPVVGPDGTIYVVFGNGNTPTFGVNQVLFVKCPVGSDCTQAASWSAPVKINDLIGLHPIAFAPNPAGCPVGRQCLPPNGYRVPEFTSMSISVDSSNRLYTVWSDFRNGGPPCHTLDFATSTPPCDNDVFYSFSTDGGATWSTEKKVSPAGSAQWQPWSEVTSNGSALWIAYYDRSYGTCETSGCNDITAVKVGNAATASPSFSFTRVTTSSMPNLTTLTNPIQAGFLGDYMWLDTDSKGRAHIVWADTRGKGDPADPPEEDIYYATVK